MTKRVPFALAGILFTLVAAACGGDDDDGPAAGASGAGTTGGAAGASGTISGAAGSSTSGTAGSSAGASGSNAGTAGSNAGTAGSHAATSGTAGAAGSTAGAAGSTAGAAGSNAGTAGGGAAGNAGTAGNAGSAGAAGGSGGVPAGWLYTKPGDTKVYVSSGGSGSVWMGRGVNVDDIFLCGYNYGVWMSNPDGEGALTAVLDALVASWKPNFFRVSLAMDSYSPSFSWTDDNVYKTSMIHVIHALGAHPNTYVLVTLRSDTTMTNASGDACGHTDDAVCIPTAATDAAYRALVDSFKDAPYVLFGLSNEPGGNSASDDQLRDSMSHAVSTIRAEEDLLGVPHHLISVQGNQWTSSIGFYATTPLPYDNLVYEYHSYPPSASGYTQTTIPVIIGEYGPIDGDTSFTDAFYADVEAKQIPNLAWTASPYSDCSPDLLNVTHDATLITSSWGGLVQAYLSSH